MRTLIALLLATVFSACQSNPISSGDLQRTLTQEPFIGFQDDDVENLRQLEPSTAAPLRIGIAQPWTQPGNRYGGYHRWTHPGSHGYGMLDRWTREERELLEAMGDELVAEGRIAELIVLPGLLSEDEEGNVGHDVISLRRAAARHQLDAVLVCRSISAVGQGASFLSLLDLTIIGAFVIPSHHAEAVTVVEGAIFDVRSEFLYASGIGDGAIRVHDTLASIDPDEVLLSSRLEATRDLAEQLLQGATARQARWVRQQEQDPGLAEGEPEVLELPGITIVQDDV